MGHYIDEPSLATNETYIYLGNNYNTDQIIVRTFILNGIDRV
jgi:hypothetical protein